MNIYIITIYVYNIKKRMKEYRQLLNKVRIDIDMLNDNRSIWSNIYQSRLDKIEELNNWLNKNTKKIKIQINEFEEIMDRIDILTEEGYNVLELEEQSKFMYDMIVENVKILDYEQDIFIDKLIELNNDIELEKKI